MGTEKVINLIDEKSRDRFSKYAVIDDMDPDACWGWTAAKCAKGYARFFYKNTSQNAHRISWMISFGEIPKGYVVCRTCGNLTCTNPRHLELVSYYDRAQKTKKKMDEKRREREEGVFM